MTPSTAVRHYRAIWISDVHLGTRGCQADQLLDFLRSTESDYLYLVGDIVDGWRLRRSWYWPQAHNDVVQKLLRKARKGTRVIYLPGNHDEGFRDYIGMHFGGVTVMEDVVHVTADGRLGASGNRRPCPAVKRRATSARSLITALAVGSRPAPRP